MTQPLDGIASIPRSIAKDPAWFFLCVAGALGAIATAVLTSETLRLAILVLIGLVSVVTMLVGTTRMRPAHRWVWISFAAGSTIVVVATLVGASVWSHDPTTARSWFLTLRIIGHTLLLGGFCGAALIRNRHNDLSSLLDALILGLAIGLIAWRTTFNTALDQSVVSTTNALAVSLLPMMGVIACTMLLRRAFSAERTSTSFRLLLLAACAVTMAHLVSGVAILNGSELTSHTSLQIALITLIAAAAAHPSMHAVTEPVTVKPNKFGATRIALLALALLDTPIVILLDHGRFDADNAPLLVGACVMSVIVVIRLISLAREMEQTRLRERRREERFEALVQNSSDLIVVLDEDDRVTYASPSVATVMGYRPSALTGERALRGIHPDDIDHVDAALQAIAPGTTSDFEVFRLLHAGGHWRWVESRAVNLIEDPLINGIIVTCRDVTERLVAQALIDDSIARQGAVAQLGRIALSAPNVRGLTESAADLVRSTLEVHTCEVLLFEDEAIEDAVIARQSGTALLVDQEYPCPRIIDACRNARRPIQFTDPDPSGPLRASGGLDLIPLQAPIARPERVVPEEPSAAAPQVLAVRITDRDRVMGAILARSGTARRFNEDEADFLSTMAGTLGLALARRKAEDTARHQSLHDALTGLPNRALFVDRLTHALERARRTQDRIAVLFLDIDHFKVINDSLGHSAGDHVLAEVSARLRALLRPGDTVARFGGDEFTILLDPLRDRREAEHIAERIRVEVARATTVGATALQPTASVGIALASQGTSNAETLLRDADAAMYQAKERGRNGVAVFDDTMRDKVIHRLRTEIDLPRAITNDELVMYYQPIVALDDDRVAGVEALVRWRHPELGLISPDAFIPIAELSGLIEDLDHWVMQTVMRQCALDHETRGSATHTYALNVSARTIASRGFPSLVASVLDQSGVPPEKICIEITESALMNDLEHSIAVLRALRDLGVAISVDDFGTGYSSLTYLKRLPATALKVDSSFTSGITDDPRDRAIVESVVSLAATLEMVAVAEGVETQAQRDLLTRMGCPLAQGYHFGRPAPIEALSAMATQPA